MDKFAALELPKAIEKCRANFSRKDRACNFAGETYEFESQTVLSGDCAAVVFSKSSGKKAIAFFYWMHKGKYWLYFFPTDGHILGFQEFSRLRREVEDHNYLENFSG